jgi:L,D-transpeptidase YcbB
VPSQRVFLCVMRYFSDLHVGRINPQHLGFEFDVSQKKLDLAEFVRERLVDGSDLRAEVAAVAPPFPGYQRLRDALQIRSNVGLGKRCR